MTTISMKTVNRTTLLLCLLIYSFSSSGQNNYRKMLLGKDSLYLYPFPYYSWSFNSNPEIGEDKSYHSGTTEGLFITGLRLPDGKWMAYFNKPKRGPKKEQQDKIAMLFGCSGGTLNGHATIYNRMGKRIAEGEYLNGTKDKTWTIYLEDGKTVLQILNYKEGVPDGSWEDYTNGKINVRLHLSNGKREGIQTLYFPSGSINKEFPYHENLADGEEKIFFKEGTLSYLYRYKNGNKEGLQESYFRDGKRESISTNFHGANTGWVRKWNKAGLLVEETHYLEDTTQIKFLLSLPHNRYDENNRFLDGPIRKWYANGKLESIFNLKAGVRVGRDTSFFEDGTVRSLSYDSLSADKKTTIRLSQVYYHQNHRVETSTLHIQDSLSIEKEYTKNGTLTGISIKPSYVIRTTIKGKRGGDSTVLFREPFITLSRIYTSKGQLTEEEVLDPRTKNQSKKSFSRKGILLSESTSIAGKTRINNDYDKRGRLLKRYYYAAGEESLSLYSGRGYGRSYDYNLDSVRFYKKGLPRNGKYKIKSRLRSFTYGELVDGRKSGLWKRRSGWKITSEQTYVKGQEEGTSLVYATCTYNYSIWGHKHPFTYLRYKNNYVKGYKEGMCYDFTPGGDVETETEYHHNLKNGKETSYHSKGKLSALCYYTDDKLNGNLKRWNVMGQLTTDRNYILGECEGKVNVFFYETGIKMLEGQYLSGKKTGEWKHYFKNGACKATLQFIPDIESDQLRKKFGIESLAEEKKRMEEEKRNHETRKSAGGVLYSGTRNNTSDDSYNKLEEQDAHVVYYFENGIKAQEGYVLEGNRVGVWNWWREDGTKEKEVDYTKGDQIFRAGDTLHFNGKYLSWYSNGNKSLVALIMNEDHKYDCRKEVVDNIQNLFYLQGWDLQGKETISGGNGYFKGQSPGGVVRSEGAVLNGLKEGPWTYRDENGRVNSKGVYSKGLEEGKWLSGDLEGIHSIENACFRDLTNDEMERLLRKLEVTELWYEEGVATSRLRHNNEEKGYRKKRMLHPKRNKIYYQNFSVEHRQSTRYQGGDSF
jgi:antitoxin component YwqK of YwqJK toxin-antitoxin module